MDLGYVACKVRHAVFEMYVFVIKFCLCEKTITCAVFRNTQDWSNHCFYWLTKSVFFKNMTDLPLVLLPAIPPSGIYGAYQCICGTHVCLLPGHYLLQFCLQNAVFF